MPSEAKQRKGMTAEFLDSLMKKVSTSVIRTHYREAEDMAYLGKYLSCKHEVISFSLRTFDQVGLCGMCLESLYWVGHLTRSKSVRYPTCQTLWLCLRDVTHCTI